LKIQMLRSWMSRRTWVRAWVRPMPIWWSEPLDQLVADGDGAGVVDPVPADPFVVGGARIALDPDTVQLLLEHRARVEAQCLRARARLDRDAFVFSLAPDHSSPLLPR
jgi:hypothetical protein